MAYGVTQWRNGYRGLAARNENEMYPGGNGNIRKSANVVINGQANGYHSISAILITKAIRNGMAEEENVAWLA
jgi:hypothetical protein